MNEKNLWGDLTDLVEIITPKSVLQKQARLLNQLTMAILTGEVTSEITGRGKFEYQLDILAPYLNNYRYTILGVSHGIDFYPLDFHDFVNEKVYECRNEDGFLEALKEVLSSDGVRKIISSLIAQSKA